MKMALRHFETGLYLSRGCEWTEDPCSARTFKNRFGAGAYKVSHGLTQTKIVAIPGRKVGQMHQRITFHERLTRVPQKPVTLIEARIELGTMNRLFIRGEGEGLDWRQGQPMTRMDPFTWTWSACPALQRIEFQLLLDDLIWAKGDNVSLHPGARVQLTPDFDWPEIPRVQYPVADPTVSAA
jgi:hypothetical protein